MIVSLYSTLPDGRRIRKSILFSRKCLIFASDEKPASNNAKEYPEPRLFSSSIVARKVEVSEILPGTYL